MKRWLLAVVVLTLGVTAVAGYTLAFREQEFSRLIAAGDEALAADESFQAIEAFSGAVVLKSGSMLAHLKRGETYLRRGDHAAALRDLRKAAHLDPTAPRPLELLGDANYALQRYVRAADHYVAYTKLDDRSSRVLHKLALARLRHGDAAGAIPPLRQVVTLDPEAAHAQYLLGVCLRRRGEVDEARRVLEQAIAAAPGLTEAREELADLHLAQDRPDAALAQLEVLATLEPRPERAVQVGLRYAARGRADLAVTAISRAAEQQPRQASAYAALGRVWLSLADERDDAVALSKAIEALRGAVGGGPASSESLTLLGRALLLDRKRDEAEAVLLRATETFPVDVHAFEHYAEAVLRRGDVVGARDALAKHHALLPPTRVTAALPIRIARLSARANDWASAATWLRRVAIASTVGVDLLAELAEAEWRAGQLEAARATLARGLSRDPAHEALLALRARLEQ